MPGARPQSHQSPKQVPCWVLLGAEHPVPGGMQPGSAVQERRPCGWLPEGTSCSLKNPSPNLFLAGSWATSS